jgi:hypothetical protein
MALSFIPFMLVSSAEYFSEMREILMCAFLTQNGKSDQQVTDRQIQTQEGLLATESLSPPKSSSREQPFEGGALGAMRHRLTFSCQCLSGDTHPHICIHGHST